jgi:TolB-like protein/Tfp pilus assembly protein PilF
MIYRFGEFELDTAKQELRAGGNVRLLEPQVYAVLALLVENRDRLVATDELIEKVWDGRVISDAAVSSRIKSARQALGDDGKLQRYIRTRPRQGFRFVADVSAERPLPPAAEPAQPPARPSIAVLPFRTVGKPGRYATIADALPHDLILELSRLRWLLVTARASSFRVRDSDADPIEVGRLLGVRYCLRGTMEVAGRRLAVAVELADTRDGSIVWADRFAGAVEAVHEFRSDIVARILTALEIRIPLHEASLARLAASDNLDAWSSYHLGLQHMYRFNRKDNAAASELFRRAVTLDPGFARAHAGLSFVHFQTAFLHQTDDLPAEIERARHCAERGLELDPLDPFVNFAMGRSFWLAGDLESSQSWLERATAISPNYAQGIYALGWTESLSGRGREGRAHVDLAMRLSPLDPLHYAMVATRAFTHMLEGEDAEAARWADRAAHAPGAHVLIAMIAVAAHGLAGDAARARAWADNVRARQPGLGIDDFFRAFPMRSAEQRARIARVLTRYGVLADKLQGGMVRRRGTSDG